MKFEFRTRRSFETESDYDEVFVSIERIRSRCRTYQIRENFDRHPAKAFEFMSLPESEGERYLSDDYLLFSDAADNLLRLNETISGKYRWDEIADIVNTRIGVGVNDWHWELHTYVLKPEYAQILIDNLDMLEKEIRDNYETFLLEEKREEDKRNAIRKSIVSISTSERTIFDEGGRTKEYTHTITFHDGQNLTFIERSVFDFGIVINPAYSVADGVEPGGICINQDGIRQWHNFVKDKGWVLVRPLTENEMTAIDYLRTFGKFSGSGVRM